MTSITIASPLLRLAKSATLVNTIIAQLEVLIAANRIVCVVIIVLVGSKKQ